MVSWLPRIFRRASKLATSPVKPPLRGDSPIRSPKDDSIGRKGPADHFVQQVLSLDASEGLVVAVLGPWGSGKTSFINLARDGFAAAGVRVLNFNPWMFSGAEQLMDSFFVELADQLKVHRDLADIAGDIEDYGDALSGFSGIPYVGMALGAGKGIGKIIRFARRRKQGVGGRKEKLERALAALGKPLVVVLDDIDRLSTAEIRDVFKLVRLTASFPNLIYVLAFDRQRVEEALEEHNLPGRDYLEKILQIAVDLPAIPREVLDQQIFTALDGSLSGLDGIGALDAKTWPDIFTEIVRPPIRHMRDVRRYALGVRGTVVALGGQVALADVLGMEAVRIFLPDVFARLHSSVDLLTGSNWSGGGRDDDKANRAAMEELVKAAGDNEQVVRDMVHRLFPAVGHLVGGMHYGGDFHAGWLKARRISHKDLLSMYLEKVAGTGLLAFADAERAWAVIEDMETFGAFLLTIESGRLQDVISSLEVYEHQMRPSQVVPASIVLLNSIDRIPWKPRSGFSVDATLAVRRVVLRLMRSIGDADAVEKAVREILPNVRRLGAREDLVSLVSHQKGAGHKLVSEKAAAELERTWRDQVRAASAADLAQEREPLEILLYAKREASQDEPGLIVPESPELTLAILRTSRSEATSQQMGSRTVEKIPMLAWEVLELLFGGEDAVKTRVDAARGSSKESDADLLQLFDKYVSGWRPKPFHGNDDED